MTMQNHKKANENEIKVALQQIFLPLAKLTINW
jgi:hypothetical protein